MRTVLPTPAPPKSPILPPLLYGSSKSIALMPVSRISTDGLSSGKAGAGRYIPIRSAEGSMSSPPSMGLPSTLNILPRVRSPTGTSMHLPVAVTRIPRASPSLSDSIMQRTTCASRCCATSITLESLPSPTVSASRRCGSASSNITSTTGPEILVIMPSFIALLPCVS